MSNFNPTLAQQEAIDTLDCNVSVSAGAGSGKTEVLVQRFCKIVELGLADVDEILTVTFTEKAAKEMKQRITSQFSGLSENDDTGRFETAMRDVESANIGTIHSFASRILRENAFEAGIDPNFGMLTDPESIMLKDSVVEELISDGYTSQDDKCLYLVNALGEEPLKYAIKKLHSHFASLGKSISEGKPALSQNGDAEQLALDYFRYIEDLSSQEVSPALDKQLDVFLVQYPDLKAMMKLQADIIKEKSPEDYALSFDWQTYEDLAFTEKFVAGNAGTPAQKEDFIKPAKAIAKAFRQAIIAPVAEYHIQCLLKMTQQFGQAYTAAKRSVGALDFDDLLSKTQDLLISSDGTPTPTALLYREKFKYVVLDEFQDTNSLQKRLVESVCRPDRLFTVGDVKQSIFSFIHSDVSVFIGHHQSVEKSESGKTLAFVENFRSRESVVGFVNWLFRELWSEDGGFEFEELQARGSFCEHTSPDIELILTPKTAGAEQARYSEAVAIANKVRELLGRDGQKPFQVREKDDTRDLSPKDIMLLFRSTSNISIYERALHEAGIEYYVVSGRGFYSKQEVRDMLSLLRLVENPLDDVAMASVLRSPMVAVSDDTLWWLTRESRSVSADNEEEDNDETDIPARNRNIGKLYAGVCALDKLTEISPDDRNKLKEFKDLLAELHSVRSDSRISRLINTAVSKTNFDLKLLASPNGKRKYANVRKLLEMAESMQGRGMFSISDFIRHIDDLSVISEREGEAPTETEDSPVVRLMTVHKSKGLQAPVVIVADSSHQIRAGDTSTFIANKEASVACKLKNELSDEWIPTSAYENIAETTRDRDIGEEKRLFYVAATRAEELLIISGCSEYKGSPAGSESYSKVKSWSGWVEKALNMSTEPAYGECLLDAGGIPVHLTVGNKSPCEAASLSPSLAQLYPGILESGGMLPVDDDISMSEVVNRCLAPVQQTGSSAVQLTVSQALDYFWCPGKYYLKWVLGLPEASLDYTEEPEPTNTEGSYSGATVGSAVHQVLGALDFAGDIEEQILRFSAVQDTGIRKQVELYCKKLLGTEWYERIKASHSRMQEVPFRIIQDDCSLLGRIDLLIEEESGWVVIDYKTGSISEKDRYGLQVSIYAYAVKQCLSVMPREIVLVNLGDGDDCRFEVNESTLKQAEELLLAAFNGIRENDFTSERNSRCKECGYNKLEQNICTFCC